jgi:nucleotide-binding universal stress UspA family protein
MSGHPILVGYDGSDHARAALRWAVDVAQRRNAPVHIVFAIDWPSVVPPMSYTPGWPDEQMRRDAEGVVAEAAAEAHRIAPQLTVRSTVADGPAAAALWSRTAEARMVVLGHRGIGGFSGLLLGSVGVAVSAHAHCPVVVVRGEAPPEGTHQPVAVGVDESPQAHLAIGFAFEEAASRGVGLVAVRAWEPPQLPWHSVTRPLVLDVDELEAAERHLLTEALAGWRDKYPAVPVSTRLIPSGAVPALIAVSHDAQLVVVGSRGRGGFAGLLLGSVSQQLLHHAYCPVAVVREAAGPAGSAEGLYPDGV